MFDAMTVIWVLVVVHTVLTFVTLLVVVGAINDIHYGSRVTVTHVNALMLAAAEWATAFALWQVATGRWP